MPISRVERIPARASTPGTRHHLGFLALCLAAFVVPLIASARAQDAPPQQVGQVEGVVRDAAGAPIAGASVLLQQEGGSTPSEVKTNAEGAFVFFPLRAGMYTVKAQKPGFRDAADYSIKLAPPEKKHCDFVLRSAEATDSSSSSSSSTAIELDDRPNFTVAGIADSTGSGGHGSETRMRTGDALAQETVKLESGASEKMPADTGELSKKREQVNKRLVSEKSLSRRDEGDLRRLLGDLDEKLEDPLSAEREYERAASLNPSEQNYFAWGAELLLHGAAVPAMEVFSRGARLHPGSARMLAGLGAALYASGSADEAAQRLCQASDLEPANPAPYLFLGKMQEAVSTPLPCAEQKLAHFAQEQPSNSLANYYYALALWKRERASRNGSENSNRVPEAEALLEKSIALDPKLDSAYLQLGNLQFEHGAFRQAIAAYQKAIAANPLSGEAHYRLALACKRIGEEAKAQSEFEQYKQLDKAETETFERRRRELRQFLFVLKNQPAVSSGTSDVLPQAVEK